MLKTHGGWTRSVVEVSVGKRRLCFKRTHGGKVVALILRNVTNLPVGATDTLWC